MSFNRAKTTVVLVSDCLIDLMIPVIITVIVSAGNPPNQTAEIQF